MLLFNRYEYSPQADLIGKGRLARVYKALDKNLNTTVALKIWKTGGDPAVPYIQAADRPALISLSHPHIVRYLAIEEIEKEDAFGETETIQVCALEWSSGGSILPPSLTPANPVPRPKSLDDLKQLLTGLVSGLTYLHTNGIAHNNIKASNILIQETPEGPVGKIADFGAVSQPVLTNKTAEDKTDQNKAAHNKAAYEADFQSLAAVFYELFTGESLHMPGEALLLPGSADKLRSLPESLLDILFNRTTEPEATAPLQSTATLPLSSPALSGNPVSSPPVESSADDTQILRPTPQSAASDDTQLLKPTPSATPSFTDSDDTQILSTKPTPAATQSDDTQILPSKLKQPAAQSDDTQLLNPKSRSTSSSDDTQLLPSQATTTPVSSDDTQVLPSSRKSSLGASDDTQILPSQSKPSQAASDDTQILPSQSKTTSAQSDDTQLLNPKSRSTSSSDDTQLLPTRKEETLSLFSRYEYNPTSGLIGKGGFSRVYKAYDKKLNRWVALKIYKGGEFGDRYSAIAEIRRVVNLDHSNICRYLDIEEIEKENSFGEKEVTQICVMELLDGGNFAEYYNTHKDDKVLKKLLNDVLNGLSYLHKNGIIHRDIKPANILIKETLDGPVAKITDFGISKISDSVNNNSSSALIVSIPYMSPEQLNVKKYGVNEKISYNLDLWSLGVTIYELVTGKVLFKNSEQDSSEQIMTNIMAPGLPEKIRELRQPFRDIVAHCIVKDARDRAQKAEELIVLLHSNYEAAAAQPLTGPGNTSETKTLSENKVSENKTIADGKVANRSKSSFLVDNDTEEAASTKSVAKKITPANLKSKEQEAREKRMRLISIVSFVVVFLAITLYFLTKGPKKEDLTTTAAQKADSATTTATPPAKVPATTSANTGGALADSSAAHTTIQPSSTAKTDPSTTNQATTNQATTNQVNQSPTPNQAQNQSAATPEKKPRKPAANTEQQEASTASSGNQKYVLILTTTQSCTVKINHEDYGKLEAGKSLKVFLMPGNYVLQAISLSNSASVYNGNLEVSEKNRSQVGQYRIPLN